MDKRQPSPCSMPSSQIAANAFRSRFIELSGSFWGYWVEVCTLTGIPSNGRLDPLPQTGTRLFYEIGISEMSMWRCTPGSLSTQPLHQMEKEIVETEKEEEEVVPENRRKFKAFKIRDIPPQGWSCNQLSQRFRIDGSTMAVQLSSMK